MNVTYKFEKSEHRIGITSKLKGSTNLARLVLNSLKESEWKFHGVVRDYTTVVSDKDNYLALHFFTKDKPNEKLIGYPTDFIWYELIEDEAQCHFLSYLETLGFTFMIPHQVYLDSLRNHYMAMMGIADINYHLLSPKHKLQVWAFHESMSLHIEIFTEYPLAPYGVSSLLDWPDTSEIVEHMDLFAMLNIPVEQSSVVEELPMENISGESFELAASVDQVKLKETMDLIEYTFQNYEHIILASSFGKDSSVTVQLYLNYYMQNRDCKTKLTIVTSDTLIDNPLLINHVYKTKDRIESLGLNIDFHVVKPETSETFFSKIFASGYQPSSPLNKWCVSRLKVDPATKLLKEISKDYNSCLLVLGTRTAESVNRANSVRKHFGDEFFGEHPISNIKTCSPIKHWTATDVMTYLVRTPTPWSDYSNFNIINLYGSAMSSSIVECPVGAAMTDVDEGVSACTGGGKSARMGCVYCCVIKSDTSLINMARDYEELEPYVHMRKVFKAVQDIRYGSLTGFKRTRTLKEGEAGEYIGKFESGFGDLTVDIRIILLNEMSKNNLRISSDEVHYIYQEVRRREFIEGMAIPTRFQDALFEHLPVHMGYFDTTYSPIWDPYGCGVDAITEEDKASIARVLARQAM